MQFDYDPGLGAAYAQTYALIDLVPPQERLFYHDPNDDCTNFISQCVWAGYGGWLRGLDAETVAENRKRILKNVRQVDGVWYGSASHIGSPAWCRVVDFYNFVTNAGKSLGPLAHQIMTGPIAALNPAAIRVGDVIQMVVTSYTPDRFGHGLYVTHTGPTLDDVLICCHTMDRLNVPMSWFAQYPDTYAKQRVLRFSDAWFAR